MEGFEYKDSSNALIDDNTGYDMKKSVKCVCKKKEYFTMKIGIH